VLLLLFFAWDRIMAPRHAAALLAAAALCCAGARAATAVPPLRTQGRWLIDSTGARVKLACLNWYGLDQMDFVVGGLQFHTLAFIAGEIATMGFNCVRLPFSLQLVLSNPPLAAKAVTAEPLLQGKNGLDAFDATVAALDAAGLMIILDNHMSTGDWCCSTSDGNGACARTRCPASQ
jgi:endoglucanase